MTQQQHRQAYLYLSLTTSIWGSLYIAARLALQTIPPVTLLCLRFAIAFAGLFAISRFQKNTTHARRKIDKADYRSLAFIGIVGYFLSIAAQLTGTKYAGASVASLVNAMNPISISLFAVLFLKERLTFHKIIAVLASVSGAYIILLRAETGEANIGVIFSIVSVILWSFSSIVVRRMAGKYTPLTITLIGIGIGGACALPAALLELRTFPGITEMFSLKNVLYVTYIGIVCTALPQWLWNKSLSLVEASTCSLFYPLQPLVSVLLGIAILGERIDLQFILGAICIIGGILYAVLSERRNLKLHKKDSGRVSRLFRRHLHS